MAITLIVEDGTGLADANVYCDVDFLELQAELLGDDISEYSEENKKAALYVAANKYIDRLHEFKGTKVDSSQGMKLYTDQVSYDDASKDIMTANAEAAILHLKGYLFVSESEQNANGNIKREMSKLDVLEEEIEYEEGTRIRTKYNTYNVDNLLTKYLAAGSGGVPMRVV